MLREDSDLEPEEELKPNQELAVIQRRLLDHHWGFFVPGIAPRVVAHTAPREICSNTTGELVCETETRVVEVLIFNLLPEREGAPVNVTESEIVARRLIDAGVPYSQTDDGVYFEAIPSGVSVEPLPPGVSLDDYTYHEH